MEIIVGILIGIWSVIATIAMFFIYKSLSGANININVKHENSFTEVPFNDLYDKSGDVKKEHTLDDAFNEVFKEFNELMTGEEVVNTNG
jgi:hypothetical protein